MMVRLVEIVVTPDFLMRLFNIVSCGSGWMAKRYLRIVYAVSELPIGDLIHGVEKDLGIE